MVYFNRINTGIGAVVVQFGTSLLTFYHSADEAPRLRSALGTARCRHGSLLSGLSGCLLLSHWQLTQTEALTRRYCQSYLCMPAFNLIDFYCTVLSRLRTTVGFKHYATWCKHGRLRSEVVNTDRGGKVYCFVMTEVHLSTCVWLPGERLKGTVSLCLLKGQYTRKHNVMASQ